MIVPTHICKHCGEAFYDPRTLFSHYESAWCVIQKVIEIHKDFLKRFESGEVRYETKINVILNSGLLLDEIMKEFGIRGDK